MLSTFKRTQIELPETLPVPPLSAVAHGAHSSQHCVVHSLGPYLSARYFAGVLSSTPASNLIHCGAGLFYQGKHLQTGIQYTRFSYETFGLAGSLSRRLYGKLIGETGYELNSFGNRCFLGVQYNKFAYRRYFKHSSHELYYRKKFGNYDAQFRTVVCSSFNNKNTSLSVSRNIGNLKAHLLIKRVGADSVKAGLQLDIPIGDLYLFGFWGFGSTSIGLKKQGFVFQQSIARLDKWYEVAVWGLLFLAAGITYWLGKSQSKQNSLEGRVPKTIEDRRKELKMIGERANSKMMAEREGEGLVVVLAYFGTKEAVEQVMRASDRLKAAQQIPESKLLDVTIPLRFYVREGSLQVPGMRPEHWLGFCEIEEAGWILVEYYKGQRHDQKLVKAQELTL